MSSLCVEFNFLKIISIVYHIWEINSFLISLSRVVPTGHIDIKITEAGTPGHSDEFRLAANPDRAGKNLVNGILASANVCLRIMNDESLLKEIKKEFISQM